jgi:hypothetical protein
MARGPHVKASGSLPARARYAGRPEAFVSLPMWSGPAEIVAQGMATTFGGNGIYFDLVLPERTFAIAITFPSDPSVEGPTVLTYTTDEGSRIDLVNFDSAEGRGSALPALITDLGDHLLFWHFRAFKFGRSNDTTLHYCFYRVAKEEVSWTPRDPNG